MLSEYSLLRLKQMMQKSQVHSMFYRIAVKKHPEKCKNIVKALGACLISAIRDCSRLRRSLKVSCRVEGRFAPSTAQQYIKASAAGACQWG
jgi:hypothetical protein